MKVYYPGLVIRANEIGLINNQHFLDACQELIDAEAGVDVGSVYTHHLGDILPLGDAAIALFRKIHDWRMGGEKNDR
ncbi:hypothetical protein SAMN04488056_10329 [Cohaesibacter marisflavi]|uniref:Uncharacterized protein n=1 Tax=Cohaesibacter marisflavi TaxID=655353 RepID=A0A1I5E4L5_9HYPH|nr:hypothetical protein [Cohaesibacter marisflavi]SFO06448.1 hypothetical protein SAMN04488056_10329 [Cohaesibacter marisflavi]